ncbi:MAG: class II aldolase/adducin family protein [Deltaproteobacteria bacterium]|jgi:L-fuculose-phosphate aldolase|nr:class II aldolase/adducin family protein [Deltaproteobacteria bacterium]MBT6435140.1 class II aldolase/adducin family protein [Deltaproteobacteria bacterium]MBT6488606.1 class II aldolase/adducin family protein [Deltaproteobacteria bacterium]
MREAVKIGQKQSTRRDLEHEVVDYSQRLHQRGWVANHDGNISVRLEENRFLITPTAVSKGDVERSKLLVVDERGQRVSGRYRPFSEMNLHLYAYRQRPDIRVVMHAHPPTATGFAVAGVEIISTMMAEPVVSLGDVIPTVPYALPKTPESTLNMAPALVQSDAFLLQNHGVITVGPDLETAFLRMELVEHLAKIQLVAQQLGGASFIPYGDIEHLMGARAKAGLGPQGRT